jgi:Ca-activated chloride channel family protein
MTKPITGVVVLMALVLPGFASQRSKPSQPAKAATPQQKSTELKKQSQEDEVGSTDEAVRLGTDLVNILFTVVDKNNRVIGDVRRDEVTVLEDGRPQQLFTFRRETTLPINIAVLMDLSGSQEYTFPQEKMAAGEFLRSVIRPGKDAAAILTFEDDVDLVQGLTSKVDTLNNAFEEIQFARKYGPSTSRRQATALYDAVYVTADEVLSRDSYRSPANDDMVTRRAIILLTDGVDNASARKLEESIDRAWRSGVVVYSIGIGDRFRFEGIREDILKRISTETGGRAYFPRGPEDLQESFHQIESELRSQYLVAYAPTNSVRDGRFRRIEVRIADRPDAMVIHRRGYYAGSEDVKK